ncbi:hypothetical protein HMPREF3209_00861 [Lactobacillus crispatus]|jgi:hypothetical protein|nr:hypothetical protein HMPREF3209_00861 [Lactobacillus crispatus]DAO82349.1 MAG TPA: hypothetical protein [Bacteriophage sp.]
MHGIPLDLTMKANRNQLNMYWEIVRREEKQRFNMQASATGLGVWGDGKK